MKQFRRLVFWCHLSTGVLIGLVVFVMSTTEVIMPFERQIAEMSARDASWFVDASSGQVLGSPDVAIRSFSTAYSALIDGWPRRIARAAPAVS